MISKAKFFIPKLEGYAQAKNVITVQRPSELSEVTTRQALKILDKLKENNRPVYDSLRGQFNAMADQSGHRINITFPEKHPGMLNITLAPKSSATTREAADEFLAIFTDLKNAPKHIKELRRMFSVAGTLKEGENMITHTVDPKTNFIGKLQNSLYNLIENNAFKK